MAVPTSHSDSEYGLSGGLTNGGSVPGVGAVFIAPTRNVYSLAYNNYSVNNTNETGNGTDFQIPEFTPAYLIRVVTLTSIMVLSGPLNVAVFASLWRERRRKSRINLLIMHLTFADLMVTFINIPTDVIWFCTVSWLAGNAMCKILMFIESMSMYASSFVLIVISLDRFAAIVYPLSISRADRRCKIMLRVAWASCIFCSAPQVMIFLFLFFF